MSKVKYPFVSDEMIDSWRLSSNKDKGVLCLLNTGDDKVVGIRAEFDKHVDLCDDEDDYDTDIVVDVISDDEEYHEMGVTKPFIDKESNYKIDLVAFMYDVAELTISLFEFDEEPSVNDLLSSGQLSIISFINVPAIPSPIRTIGNDYDSMHDMINTGNSDTTEDHQYTETEVVDILSKFNHGTILSIIHDVYDKKMKMMTE